MCAEVSDRAVGLGLSVRCQVKSTHDRLQREYLFSQLEQFRRQRFSGDGVLDRLVKVRDHEGSNQVLECRTNGMIRKSVGLWRDRSTKVFVSGHRGPVRSIIWRYSPEQGFTRLVGAPSSEVDLRDRRARFSLFLRAQPTVVRRRNCKSGGILAKSGYPVDFLSDNLPMQVKDAAKETGVQRLRFLGSSYIQRKGAAQSTQEATLLTCVLDPTNDADTNAKIAGILQVQGNRRQHSRHRILAMPTNGYGPKGDIDPKSSHVPPHRELLHLEDLAAASLVLLENYVSPEAIKVSVGEDVHPRDMAEIVANVVGHDGEPVQDTSKPDSTPRRVLDVCQGRDLGWTETVPIRDGIASTDQGVLDQRSAIRG